MLLKWRLKIRNFFKKHRNLILIILMVWAVVLIINYLIGHQKQTPTLNTTYNPHEVVVKSDYQVPEKLQTPIEDVIDNYINKCNNQDFAGAYELLTDDCKKYAFEDSLETFEGYASSLFKTTKRYTIQNYSNYGGYYIYNLKLIDDIIKTGLTGQDYVYYEEKIAIKENGDKLQLCVNNYMGYEEPKRVGEDDNVKIRIESRIRYYGYEIYSVRITNKTNDYIVLYDSLVGDEVYLEVGAEQRMPSRVNSTIALAPNETRTFNMTFTKYYDENTEDSGIIFNKIRIMEDYTGNEQTEEEELNKSKNIYSMNIPM